MTEECFYFLFYYHYADPLKYSWRRVAHCWEALQLFCSQFSMNVGCLFHVIEMFIILSLNQTHHVYICLWKCDLQMAYKNV